MSIIGCYWVVMGIYGKIGHYLKKLKEHRKLIKLEPDR